MMTFTHYRLAGNGRTHLFTLEFCETCGHPVQAANAVGGAEKDVPIYRELGMVEWTKPAPPEQYYDENTDQCACYGCQGRK